MNKTYSLVGPSGSVGVCSMLLASAIASVSDPQPIKIEEAKPLYTSTIAGSSDVARFWRPSSEFWSSYTAMPSENAFRDIAFALAQAQVALPIDIERILSSNIEAFLD